MSNYPHDGFSGLRRFNHYRLVSHSRLALNTAVKHEHRNKCKVSQISSYLNDQQIRRTTQRMLNDRYNQFFWENGQWLV